ncbi:D-lactate dehydrogenase [cytochrome], mitochondrial [Capsicum chinense]|nr:D-lactate dehydrogenase [cytochrome], mitochondrial [Capsicum chinense]
MLESYSGSVATAIAVSAGCLALHSHTYPSVSLNDAPLSDLKSVKIGCKGSTDYAVKGSRREVPSKLIEELKGICQDNMTMDEDERYVHGKPQNSFHKAVNIPDIVVYPSVKIGCKGSTDYAVKGSRREVPSKLIEELKGICQDVACFLIF